MPIGCCGSRVTLQGLLADADFYPAQSPQGRAARARLAYGIVAGQAARVGNRPAYERALRGLNGLGNFVTSDPSLATAASRGVTVVARTATASPITITAAISGASQYVQLISTIASLGTSIARTACNGCDINAINAIDMVISWLRAIVTGSTPSIPVTLSPQELDGFVKFCQIAPQVQGPVDILLSALSAALHASGIRDAGMEQAAQAVDLIKSRVDSMFTGICQVPQIAAAVAAAAAPPPRSPVTTAQCQAADPNTIANAAGTGCTCARGLLDPARPYAGCAPVGGAAGGGGTRPTPAVGLETGAGGCVTGVRSGGPGAYNLIAPGGVRNPTTGAAIPGTAGAKSCAACHAPSRFIPGVVGPDGFWLSPPRCQSTGSGSSSSSSSPVLPLAIAAGLAWKFLF